MIDDILINKSSVIRRCLSRIDEEFAGDPRRLEDFTVLDSIVLNLLRACEASIDLAMHVVAELRLGVPQSSRNAFELMEASGHLTQPVADAMKKMCGFRNIAVHSYQDLQMPILLAILNHRLGDFQSFANEAATALKRE